MIMLPHIGTYVIAIRYSSRRFGHGKNGPATSVGLFLQCLVNRHHPPNYLSSDRLMSDLSRPAGSDQDKGTIVASTRDRRRRS